MKSQDELRAVFAELDRSADRALAGLAKVRAGVEADPAPLPSTFIPVPLQECLAVAALLSLFKLSIPG